MVFINEWLPNPAGADASGEWVELWNGDRTSVDLSGWQLTADGKKFFALGGVLGPGDYIVLQRSKTKITLRNTDGRLALYEASGRLADQASFLGSAPEGQSANRSQASLFFSKPTPGLPNAEPQTKLLAHVGKYPVGTPLNGSLAGRSRFPALLLCTALALAAAVVFILKSHENLSGLFFGADERVRSKSSR